MNDIHPTAIVSADATVGGGNVLEANVVIEGNVQIGEENHFYSGCVIKSGTKLGNNNKVHEGAVIGGLPQDLSFDENEQTSLIIGDGNTFREHVTINRATTKEVRKTVIGSDNYLMNGAHIAHDCVLGNNIIIASYSALAGHVHVADKAFISGGVMIHQFTKVGRLAMLGGNSKITQDVLPFFITDGNPASVKGLNVVGLKRAGYSASDVKSLKKAYQIMFASGLKLQQVIDQLDTLGHPLIQEMISFISDTKRSFHRPAR